MKILQKISAVILLASLCYLIISNAGYILVAVIGILGLVLAAMYIYLQYAIYVTKEVYRIQFEKNMIIPPYANKEDIYKIDMRYFELQRHFAETVVESPVTIILFALVSGNAEFSIAVNTYDEDLKKSIEADIMHLENKWSKDND